MVARAGTETGGGLAYRTIDRYFGGDTVGSEDFGSRVMYVVAALVRSGGQVMLQVPSPQRLAESEREEPLRGGPGDFVGCKAHRRPCLPWCSR